MTVQVWDVWKCSLENWEVEMLWHNAPQFAKSKYSLSAQTPQNNCRETKSCRKWLFQVSPATGGSINYLLISPMKVAVQCFEVSISNSRKCNSFIVRHDCNSHQRDNEREALNFHTGRPLVRAMGMLLIQSPSALFCSVEVTWVNKTKWMNNLYSEN